MAKPQSPVHIRQRARRILNEWQTGSVYARKTYRYRYLTLAVSPGWRLLSKDNGNHWELLSHADYNNQI
jgi:hypothetical protein